MKIIIGSDHRGVALKNMLIDYLKSQEIEVLTTDLENYDTDDYPDFAFEVANKVLTIENSLGIVICGNGIGISIAANKVKGIRCARVVNSDDAFKAKNHNGVNMIAFGGLDEEEAKQIVDMFITTKTAGEERHLKRIQKMIDYENGEYHEP